MHDLALDLLKRASVADDALYDKAEYVDRFWLGRLVTFNNFAVLFSKIGDLNSALKFTFDG
jgi:hypothetical protein